VLPDAGGDDIGDVREIVASIDPQHPLLKDPKLPVRFAELAREAIKANDYPRAKRLIDASRAYAPDDVTLADLRHQVEVELKRQADEKLAAELTRKLSNRWRALLSLDDFSAVHDDLLKLDELSPSSPLLTNIRGALERAIGAEITTVIETRDWSRGERAMTRFARLVSLPFLSTQRARLGEAETTHGYRIEQTEARRSGVAARESRLRELLDKPEFTPAWERRVATPLKELIAVVAPDDPALIALRARLGKLYVARAARARKGNRFAEARDLLDTGRRYAPQFAELGREGERVARAEQALRERQAEERRQVRIAALKKSLIDKARVNRPKEALATRTELAKELADDDPFLTTAAPHAIAGAYLRLAANMAQRKDFDAARGFAARAVKVAPDLDAALKAARGYRDQLLALAVAAQVETPRAAPRDSPPAAALPAPGTPPESVSSLLRIGADQLATPALATVAPQAPERGSYAPRIVARYPALGDQVAARAAEQIKTLSAAEPLAIRGLGGPLASYAALYPKRYPTLRTAVAEQLETRVVALAAAEPLDISALAIPLDEYAVLYPERAPALRARVAATFEPRIIDLAKTAPLDLELLGTPLDRFAALFPQRAAGLDKQVASRVAPRIVTLADSAPLDLKLLAARLDRFATLFPESATKLNDQVASRVAPRVVALAGSAPLDLELLAARLDRFATLFPESTTKLNNQVATRVAPRIVALAGAKPLAIGAIRAPLAAYRKRFPKRSTTLDAKIAAQLEARITKIADNAGLKLNAIAGLLDAYAKLYKKRSAALRARTAERVAKRISVAGTATPKAISRLKPTMQRYRRLFPRQASRLGATLAARIVKRIKALKPKDVYAADAVRRAGLALLPGNKAIMSIRLELPLQELIDGTKLLASGRLSAARNKLTAAIKTDPKHSDIPGFKRKLETKIRAAQAKYDKYLRLTRQRLGRTERIKLLAGARSIWRDNKKFVDVAEPRGGLCTAALAGNGLAKASTCYDFLSKRIKGPLLVVIPPGGGVAKPFAIGKYEVSGKEFGRYCRATKKCKPVSGRKSRQPITRISIKQAKAYARWLSKRASAAEKRKIRYRLPTEPEWEHMAKAGGKQPASRAFNCRVTSGGKIIKGHGLNSATSGKPNGWGVVNAVGNARE